MPNFVMGDLQTATTSAIHQAISDFATALAATPQFQAFEQAEEQFRQDTAAQDALQAYQDKRQSLQALLMLKAVSDEEQAKLQRLYQAFLEHPSVMSYLQSLENLSAVCRAVADLVSERIGLNFAVGRSGGCCG